MNQAALRCRPSALVMAGLECSASWKEKQDGQKKSWQMSHVWDSHISLPQSCPSGLGSHSLPLRLGHGFEPPFPPSRLRVLFFSPRYVIDHVKPLECGEASHGSLKLPRESVRLPQILSYERRKCAHSQDIDRPQHSDQSVAPERYSRTMDRATEP